MNQGSLTKIQSLDDKEVPEMKSLRNASHPTQSGSNFLEPCALPVPSPASHPVHSLLSRCPPGCQARSCHRAFALAASTACSLPPHFLQVFTLLGGASLTSTFLPNLLRPLLAFSLQHFSPFTNCAFYLLICTVCLSSQE